jgi:AmiR/NasT family two-component response regulator
MKRPGIPHLGGARALVLHRAHADGAAVLRLTERGQTEAEAFALLRRLAMDGQTTLETAAARLLNDSGGGAHERSGRP